MAKYRDFFSHIKKRAVHVLYTLLTFVNLSSLRRLASSISTGDRGRYFSRSAGDTEFRWKQKEKFVLVRFRHFVCIVQRIPVLTNRSSADGPPSGTLISSLCKSCGTLSNACGPCGNPIGPANDPNEPANVGIGCGVNGICWACICCYTSERKKWNDITIWNNCSWLFWAKYCLYVVHCMD